MRCAAAVAVAAAVPSSSYSAGTNRMVFRPDTRATLYSGARRSLRALEVSASKVAVGALREEGDDDGASWPVESGVQYKRIMLKVSGEALQGKMGFGVDPQVLRKVAMEIAQAHLAGVEVAVVVGGGNFFRGAAAAGDFLDRATGDYVGMLATCMNAIMLQSALEREFAVPSRVMTAIEMKEVAEPYIRRRAIRHLERGRVVIFGAGTGNPFFTTDTAAALRAVEIGAEVFMKATKVDGVYDCDPKSNPGASLFKRVSYGEVMSRGLNVMDATAITLCRENDIPVLVFNLYTESNVIRAARGEDVGTLVSSDCEPGIKSKGKLQGPGPAAGAPVA